MRIRQILHPKEVLLEDQRSAANIVTDVLLELSSLSKPDVSLEMLNELAERMITERGGKSCYKGYMPRWAPQPYPAAICCSVNHEICHAPPRGRTLKNGDIVKYDIAVRYKSGCGDAALTVAIGDIDNRKQRAMRYGLEALYKGIEVVKAGVPISAIGRAIESFIEPRGYTIIREFGGHHIGREMHEKPDIPNKYYEEDDHKLLQEGKIICIEPMITCGKGNTAIAKEDGWTAFVKDGQPVVVWEHMILVTVDGCEILTKHINKCGIV